ncbi:hypothetical protein [Nocardia harenae]|uniref:hypothetical protein n=1 Tax=Nocardia harenae TaxID=358707 RepID=UPI0008359740|nr:hypothetical protein [Nocardia harenae]
MLWVLLAVLIVAVLGLYLLRERGLGRADSADVARESATDEPEAADTRGRHRDPVAADPGSPFDGSDTAEPGYARRATAAPALEPLSPAHRTLTQLSQALGVHTPRTEAARQALEAAADRRRVAGFLLARADLEQAELTAREGLFYIRAARIAMRMDPGQELPPLPAQTEAGEVPETRTRTYRGTRITLSPSPSPATPHHHPGGRIADRLIPAGWYSEQWWRPALATGAWPPGTDALFTALFADEPPRPGAGIGLDRKDPATPTAPALTSPTSAPSPPPASPVPSPAPAQAPPVPGLAPAPVPPVPGPAPAPAPPVLDPTPTPEPPLPGSPAPPETAATGDNPTPPDSAEAPKVPIPEQDSPAGAADPTRRDLPYDDPQYRANGYGITADHPAPGNNGADYNGATRNGHRPHGPRGYEDLGGYEGGAYDPGGLDPPY